MIKIYLNKAAAEIESGQEILTAGMQKIVWVELEFSEDWDGLTKTAVFTNGTTTVDVLESSWDDNRVAVAPEVLATAGLYAKLGIYGSNADGVALPTVWCKLGKVWPGADPSGDESTLESLPVWAQLQAAIGSLDDLTTTAKENLVAAINEAAKSGGGGGGTSADLSIRVADGKIQWTKDGTTWTDLIALSELKGTDGHTPEITATKTDKTTTISVDGKAVAEIKDGENGTDGDDGYSPTATVSKTGTVTTVKITDKSGTTTAEVKDGEPGTDGTSVSISKISESTADGGSNVVTFNDGKTLTVKNGNKGSDGLSPSVTVSKSGTETTVTATDKSGTTSAVVKDGADGYSPSAKVTKTDNGVKISITDKDGTTEQEVENGTCPEVGDDYELIETITLTEDVASVSRSVETDGTAYDFDGMKVCFKVPAASTANSGFVMVGFCGAYNDVKPSAYVRLRSSATGRVSYASAEMRKKDGYWRAQIEEYFAGYSVPNISDRVNVQDHGKSYMHSWPVSDNPKLTELTIVGNSSWVIPNGTIIYVYAIRHDGAAGSGDMLTSDYDADGAVKTAGGIAKYVAENAGSGSGDMKQSDYDADGAVKSAGGIVAYVAANAPTVDDTQVSTAVSTWLTEHPEATTTVADGAVTGEKLSAAVYEKVYGEQKHVLTEVEVPLVPQLQTASDWEKADLDGSKNVVITTFFTPLTKTPRYIKIVNHGSNIVKLSNGYVYYRFANGPDETAEGFESTEAGNRNTAFLYFQKVPAGETWTYDLQEYGRKGCEYFQIIERGYTLGGTKTTDQFTEEIAQKVQVYYIYDDYVPTYTLPDDTGEFLYDLPVKYTVQGINSMNASRIFAVAPYYPDFTYNIRGGYYATINVNSLKVYYLLDDQIFDGRSNGINFSASTNNCGLIPLITTSGTTQYDTSVNAGKDNNYAWAYHKTPPASELVGPKWVAVEFLYFSQDENTDLGDAYYQAEIDKLNDEGPQNRYITRFDKQVARSLRAQLVFANPNYNDDGSKYNAMVTASSHSPMVSASWVLFGDSLTDGYGGHDMTGNYFATKIAREFNMSFDNRAKSGSNIYRGGSGNYVSVSGMIKLDEFLAEIAAGTTEQPDYITIAFGTNTFKTELGTMDDTSETDTTVYGATKRFIEQLRANCPNSVFGFVLSPKQDWGSADPNNNRDVDGARAAIKAVCDDYGVPYIDMSTQSGIAASMLPDGIHISNDQTQNLYYHAMRRFMMGL